jgi:hypothetical protein
MEEVDVKSQKDPIRKAAYFLNQQFDSKRPNWNEIMITQSNLIDEPNVDLVDSKETSYFKNTLNRTGPSSYTSYPERYKFTSLNFYVTPHTPVVTRLPYGILDYVGDVGGLLEAVLAIGTFFTFIFPAHKLSGILA